MQRVQHLSPSQLMLLGCVLFVVLCPTLAIVRDMYAHNRQLALIANGIYRVPLPANTTVLRRNAYVASLGGSGDACDYVVEQTMQTGLTRTELIAYYQVIQGSSDGLLGRGVELREPAQYYRTEVAPGLPHIIIPNRQDSTEGLVFILQVLEGRDDAGLDFRCL